MTSGTQYRRRIMDVFSGMQLSINEAKPLSQSAAFPYVGHGLGRGRGNLCGVSGPSLNPNCVDLLM